MIRVLKQPQTLQEIKFLHREEIRKLASVSPNGKPPWCGQKCLAMVAGCSIKDAVEATEMGGACGPEEIRAGMKALGIRECNADMARTRLLLIAFPLIEARHWVLEHAGLVLDPDGPVKPASSALKGVSVHCRIGIDNAQE